MQNSQENFQTPEEQIGKSKLEVLKERNIVNFDMDLSPKEKESVDALKIEVELPEFNHYGPISDDLIKNLKEHLYNLGDNLDGIIESVSRIIKRVTGGMITDFNAESAWVAVRTSLPNNQWSIPRWHKDGRYFKLKDPKDKVYKLVMAIKGAPTRFGIATDSEKFERLSEEGNKNYTKICENKERRTELEQEDLRIRRELANIVQEMPTLEAEQATLYLVGDEDAIIHSEPDMKDPRLFVSVLVGSKEQIDEWKQNG
ncbi:MAG: hypothetical protein EXS49_02795 [Candidatus Pacebacteria bacterium]|nr:hypothetical protein [Candidatus Paceibacterota bacterium]